MHRVGELRQKNDSVLTREGLAPEDSTMVVAANASPIRKAHRGLSVRSNSTQ